MYLPIKEVLDMSRPTDQGASFTPHSSPRDRKELDELTARLARLLHGIDQIEVVRARRIARINAAADNKAHDIVAEIRELSEVILMAAVDHWETFADKRATTQETIDCTGGVLKRVTGGAGELVIEDEKLVIAFLKSLGGDPGRFINTTESIKREPLQSWLADNPSRKVPGVEVKDKKVVTLTVGRAPLAQQAGFAPHTFQRAIT